MEDNRTLKELAKEAYDIQDACNLSGVVLSWGRSIKRLRELLPNAGTNEINTHAINVLFADKVAHLTDTQMCGPSYISNAYEWILLNKDLKE